MNSSPRTGQGRFLWRRSNSLANALVIQKRDNQLFAQKVITQVEKESADLSVASPRNRRSSRPRQAVSLAQQQVDNATIRAPLDGVVLDKSVAIRRRHLLGFAIGQRRHDGLLHMADLTHVRARVLVTETDIGKVTPGLATQVLVDAYPNRPFDGVVEKMEPQGRWSIRTSQCSRCW